MRARVNPTAGAARRPSQTAGRDKSGVSGLFLLDATDADLEVHVPLAQDLGVRNDPVLAFEVDRVADLQDGADVVRRYASCVFKVDAVAVAADHRWTSTRAAGARPWKQAA